MAQSADQLLLKIGAPVGVPASGFVTVFVDTDGVIKAIDSNGNKTPVNDFGAISSASGGVQDLTVSGLSGDIDGDYVFEIHIIGDAQNRQYTLQLNGAAPPSARAERTECTNGISGPTYTADTTAMIYDTAGMVAAPTVHSIGRISVKSGRVCGWSSNANCYDGTRTGQCLSYGYYTGTSVISVGVHSSVAGGITSGSYIRIQKTGFFK